MTVVRRKRMTAAPPRPSRSNIEDVAGNIDEPFDLEYIGLLPPEELVRRWPGPYRTSIRLSIDRRLEPSTWHDALARFRGPEWARMAMRWKNAIPPVIVGSYQLDGRTVRDIFDGWGRTNYAMMTGHPLHVWEVRPRRVRRS